MKAIINGNVLTPYRLLKNASVLFEDGIIKDIPEGEFDSTGMEIIDAKGNFVAPGFIDIHQHGGGNADYMDCSADSFLMAAEAHAKHGATTIYPTATTGDRDTTRAMFDYFKKASKSNTKGADLYGLHMEGPYFSYEQKGAQDPRYLKNPDYDEYMDFIDAAGGSIKRWSVAPELPGALRMGRELVKLGILPSIAHTDGLFEDAERAFENGFTHMTHFYSGMSSVKRINAYRFAGIIEAGYTIDEMTVEVIADGCHMPASLLRMIYELKGPGKVALITDSIRAAGMPDSDSVIGNYKTGLKVIVEDGVAKLPDRTAFAGSIATCDRLVRNMMNMAHVSVIDSVRMMSSTPAKIMGIADKKGILAPEKDADIVIFNDNVDIKMTVVGGRTVYNIL